MYAFSSLLCSWVDVDTRGAVAAIPGFAALPNRVHYRIPGTPLAADVARIRADIVATFPDDAPFKCV